MTDPIWWFYLFWIPAGYHLSEEQVSILNPWLPLVVIYTSTTVGSIFGGWLSSFMIKKGISPFNARKYTMLIFALLVIPVFFAQSHGISTWGAIALIALQHHHIRHGRPIFLQQSQMHFQKELSVRLSGSEEWQEH